MKNIPNILSLLRICLLPFFIWQIAVENNINAGIILVVSGLTDLLDGYLARRNGWISQLGKVLDPLADKLTQVTVCIVLLIKLRSLWPFFLILLLKDAIMLLFGGHLIKQGIKLEGAKWFGKVATSLFYITMAVILLFPTTPQVVTISLLTITVLSSIISILMYVPEYKRYLDSMQDQKIPRKVD